ncbi:sulfotransferase family protein [Aestuariibius sp. 2305UL40-4]|uniref:sulfotransferase family protein n=1 Tax=Aestuariibius violaceus TaxID=3234132 RepID=UPI00345EBE89
MSGPVLLYGVGAAKAGTSWLYRYLHDREDCCLPAIKELHYWNTFDAKPQARQVKTFRRQIAQFHVRRADALAGGRPWQVANLDRQIDEMGELIAVLEDRRSDHGPYRDFLMAQSGEAKVVADITPAYGLLPSEGLKEMAQSASDVRFLLLLRDPVARLWSHARMLAERRGGDEPLEERAERILNRVMRGGETHIANRGNYAAITARLEAVVPEGRRLIVFTEDIWDGPGRAAICTFLGLPDQPGPDRQINVGPAVEIPSDRRRAVATFLAPHYRWAEERFGRLPDAWARHMEMV